ncbi:MAG: ABC transporter permease [Cellulomonas sp.]|nr:ABC transporter permease [Cellulomonas sp.]
MALEIATGSAGVTVLAVVLALLFGGVLIAAADPTVQAAAGYFFARPLDLFGAAWHAVSQAYAALFSGAVYDVEADSFARGIKSLTETLTLATPLILAGLGLGIGFRASLFNIGAQGQVVLGAVFAGYIGFAFQLSAPLHVLLAVLGGAIGGGLWAAIAGVLKARTGANEVIVTIMLNNIAVYLIAYLLSLHSWQRPNSNNPQSPALHDSSMFPLLLGDGFRLHAGFLLAIVACLVVWWLMERSTLGFQFRAVGANPEAARTAGISVATVTVWVMVVAGALAGLAGAAQILGTEGGSGLTEGIAGTVGIDAITVALLGRSKPLGIFFAGILFGALRAGGVVMQARTGTPIDLVLVVQSLIVLFIAAPPLVRAVFRLPSPRSHVGAETPSALTAKEVRA